MDWVPIALVTALSNAAGDTILKARFSHLSTPGMAVVRSTAPLPFLAPALLVVGWPETDATFWQTLAILLPLEIIALLLYMSALKASPLSLSVPFLAFTPAFILLTGWIVLGETLTAPGILGILITVAGAYMIHVRADARGIFMPFRAMARERGSRLMLAVSAIYGLTSVLGKRAVLHSDPCFFACFYFVFLGVVTPVILLAVPAQGPTGPEKPGTGASRPWTWPSWWTVGLSQAVMVLSHMWAISLAPAAYMIAVKRTSLLFSVILGRVVFGEAETARRLLGASLMLAGVGLIVAWG